MATEDDRQQGVELGDLTDEIESISYPVGKDELLSEYGDREIGLPDGEETLRSVLEPYQDAEFESAEDVRQAIYNMVGAEAVGRQNYTDRDAGGESDGNDESF